MNPETIQKAVEHVDSRNTQTIAEAANMILEDSAIKKGATVAIIDDPTYPFQGAKGKVTGPSAKGAGYFDVQFEDGTTTPMLASLLLVV